MITATIKEIMECWPLELKLAMPGREDFHVSLAENCRVTRRGQAIAPDDLRCEMMIRISVTAESEVESVDVI